MDDAPESDFAFLVQILAETIYAFSGLGADESVFQRLEFRSYNVHFVQWITPQKHETIAHYASRLLAQITAPRPVFVGLSFGGIVAIEVSKLIPTEKIILLASVKTRYELPFYYRWIGKLKLHRLVPAKLMRLPGPLPNWLFGTETRFEKQALKTILLHTDPVFLRWAIDQIVCWKQTEIPQNLLHIHGTRDRLLPFRFLTCDFAISGGGHFMTMNRAAEINHLLAQLLTTDSNRSESFSE